MKKISMRPHVRPFQSNAKVEVTKEQSIPPEDAPVQKGPKYVRMHHRTSSPRRF